jgi:Ca2+-binding EF-hand superfamily protein
LEKVREIRRAIRRRYANRKNFQKIFNLWDEDSNGAISVRNLYNMIHRLGININLDEARVLLASSDKDGSHDLALNEFLDLIFNEKDALNVNLKALPSMLFK